MDDHFLSRWSRRKLASKATPAARGVAPTAGVVPEPSGTQSLIPVETGTQPQAQAPAPLPPVESLTPESDFTPFMKPDVEPSLRRAALKTLFSDPRFNIMDGLDTYIDDYSKPDPLPPEWLAQMNQMKYLGHYIEEVPEKSAEVAQDDVAPAPEPMQEEPVAFPQDAQPVDTSVGDPASAESPISTDDRDGSFTCTGAKLPSNEA